MESTVYYYQYNARGDVVALTSEDGGVAAKYEYDPWGNPTAILDGNDNSVATNPSHIANINPYRYAGYRYGTESGLYYLQARYYDPSTFRFLTKDPDGGDKDDPLSQNLYAYAKDNPVKNIDPDGRLSLVGTNQTRVVTNDWMPMLDGSLPVYPGLASITYSYRYRVVYRKVKVVHRGRVLFSYWRQKATYRKYRLSGSMLFIRWKFKRGLMGAGTWQRQALPAIVPSPLLYR